MSSLKICTALCIALISTSATARTLADLVEDNIRREEAKANPAPAPSALPLSVQTPPQPLPVTDTSKPIQKKGEDIQVTGIGGIGKSLQADLLLNGNAVSGATVGNTYWGWQVVNIQPVKVELKKGSKRIELYINAGPSSSPNFQDQPRSMP